MYAMVHRSGPIMACFRRGLFPGTGAMLYLLDTEYSVLCSSSPLPGLNGSLPPVTSAGVGPPPDAVFTYGVYNPY